jgi:hypothetical protein
MKPPALGPDARLREPLPALPLLGTAVALYALFFVYLKGGLGFDFLRSDVLEYWRYSLTLTTLYNTWWVPGYPAMIAVVREATFGVLPPIAVMMSITGTFYLIGVAVFYRLSNEVAITSPRELTVLFAAYPFIGLTYRVYPLADGVATGLLWLCLLYYWRERWVPCSVFFGLMILTHKAIWFFALPLLVFAVVKHRRSRVPLLLATVPLLALIAVGAVHHKDILWMVRVSKEIHFTSQSSLPVFDGIVGSLMTEGLAKGVKGLVAPGIFLLAAVCVVPCYRRRFGIGESFALALIMMGIVVNQFEIWALVRFSSLLLLPVGYLLLTANSGLSALGWLDREPISDPVLRGDRLQRSLWVLHGEDLLRAVGLCPRRADLPPGSRTIGAGLPLSH